MWKHVKVGSFKYQITDSASYSVFAIFYKNNYSWALITSTTSVLWLEFTRGLPESFPCKVCQVSSVSENELIIWQSPLYPTDSIALRNSQRNWQHIISNLRQVRNNLILEVFLFPSWTYQIQSRDLNPKMIRCLVSDSRLLIVIIRRRFWAFICTLCYADREKLWNIRRIVSPLSRIECFVVHSNYDDLWPFRWRPFSSRCTSLLIIRMANVVLLGMRRTCSTYVRRYATFAFRNKVS